MVVLSIDINKLQIKLLLNFISINLSYVLTLALEKKTINYLVSPLSEFSWLPYCIKKIEKIGEIPEKKTEST